MSEGKSTLWWGFGGLIWGAVIALGSIIAAGAGHGWVSALPFGLLSLITVPLVTVAWAKRSTLGRKLAVTALGIAVIANVALILATFIEGTEYFYEVFSVAIGWILLWSSWQVLALMILFSSKAEK